MSADGGLLRRHGLTSDVVKALAEARRKVGASVRALDKFVPKVAGASSSSGSGTAAVPVPPAGLADMFLALLSQVKTNTTTLAMAFKPPITSAAVAPQAAKLEDQVARLVSCVLAAAGAGGDGRSALLNEWREGVSLVGERVENLFSVLETAVKDGVQILEGEQSPYLAHTGLVWSAIDTLSEGLPRTEVDAVARRWNAQKGTAKDAWDEFKEMLEDDGESDEDDDGGFDGMDQDDEWGILEAPMGKLDKAERARAEAAKPLLALHQMFHAALPRYFPLLALSPEENYAALLDAGAALVAGLDNAVAALHPGQDAGEVKTEVETLNSLGRALATSFSDRLERAADADREKRAAAKSFVQRWQARLHDETAKWDQTRMSLSELDDALP